MITRKHLYWTAAWSGFLGGLTGATLACWAFLHAGRLP